MTNWSIGTRLAIAFGIVTAILVGIVAVSINRMQDVNDSLDRVVNVAAASHEQSAGVAQINKAMGQVDDLTQSNATASEELSSTAEELAAQSEALQELISFFRLRSRDHERLRAGRFSTKSSTPAPETGSVGLVAAKAAAAGAGTHAEPGFQRF